MTELDGRTVYTRADLIARTAVSLSQLETWYRERADNGHPEAVGKIGRALVWNTQAWDQWHTARTDPTTRAGFVELAHLVGRSRGTLQRLWADRDRNGHPRPVGKNGKFLLWDIQEYQQWFTTYEHPDNTDRVDYSGNPHDELTPAEVERVLGLAPVTVATYVRRPPAGWPDADIQEPLPSGRIRRRWLRSTIWNYARGPHTRRQPGGGRPPGTTTSRRYRYDGDPRLDLARQALTETPPDRQSTLATTLAGQHGGAPGTWAAILTSARQHTS